jgi:hypothetical protein
MLPMFVPAWTCSIIQLRAVMMSKRTNFFRPVSVNIRLTNRSLWTFMAV